MGGAVILLPPHEQWRQWNGRPPADTEDLEQPYRLLAERGYQYERVDLNAFPKNPAARAHPLFKAIDPLRALAILTRKRRTMVAICFFESAALVLLMLRRLFLFRGKVIVVDLGLPDWRPRKILLDFVVPRADAILPYSVAQANAIRTTWPSAKLVVPVQAQVDVTFFAEAADQADGPVLAIGDDRSRDYGTLLQSATTILHPVVIRSRLIAPISGLPNVSILSSALPYTAYRDMLATASIIVLPLHPQVNGGGTSVIVQAMATGKAVVVSASPGVVDYVEDGVTALVVPCHDPVALAAAVNRLLTDHDLRRRMGKAARARAIQFNSYAAWADTLERVITQVTAAEPVPNQAEARPAEIAPRKG